jgi:hypothetical protein
MTKHLVFVVRKAALAGVLLAAIAPPAICHAQDDQQAQRPVRPLGEGRQGGNPPGPDPNKQRVPQPGPGPSDGFSPAYIQQLFDAMAMTQAEKFLQLTPENYARFMGPLRRLQEARNQHQRRRLRMFNQLRGLAGMQGRGDDASIDAVLKQMDTFEAEDQAAIKAAKDEIDRLLTPRQRGRFRLLEDNLEREKLEFLTRVRQNGRGPGIPK